MNKTLTTIALVLGCVLSVHAEPGTGVYDIMNDSITINDVSISSYIAGGTRQLFTAVLNGNTTSFPQLLSGRKILEVQNIDSTYDVWCRIGLSSTSANGDFALVAPLDLSTTAGRKIRPGGTWVLGLPPRDLAGRVFIPWCVNNSGSGTTKLTLTQGRNK